MKSRRAVKFRFNGVESTESRRESTASEHLTDTRHCIKELTDNLPHVVKVVFNPYINFGREILSYPRRGCRRRLPARTTMETATSSFLGGGIIRKYCKEAQEGRWPGTQGTAVVQGSGDVRVVG